MTKMTDQEMKQNNLKAMNNMLDWMASDSELCPPEHYEIIKKVLSNIDTTSIMLTFWSLYFAASPSGLETIIHTAIMNQKTFGLGKLVHIAETGRF